MDYLGLRDVAALVESALHRGQGAVVVTVVSASTDVPLTPGSRLFVRSDGEVVGQVDSRIEPYLVSESFRVLAERKSQSCSFELSTDGVRTVGRQGGNVDAFFDVLIPPPSLIIVGAGHIAVPLCKAAKLIEFDVTVIDDRPEFSNQERFPEADRILVGPYRDTLRLVSIDSHTFIVLVTRGHVHDLACLEQVIDSGAPYIGMIGSKRRVRTVIERLRQLGTAPSLLRRIHAPIGLDIAAETPAEIAVAIMAEIISANRGGTAKTLSDTSRDRV